jgi:hypothetical protein
MKQLDNLALVAKLTDAELEGLVALLRVASAEQARRSMPPLMPNPKLVSDRGCNGADTSAVAR